MTYGSICSGIEAATVAWHPLGWRPAWFAEIDKFPSAVLAHHYPEVPNLGDFTRIQPGDADPIDLLVGGTPCQSFSVAGKRLGLDDPRGNLTIEWLRLVQRILPRWVVWENVPGVLSDDGGRTFGTILGTLAKLGYGFAYRVLDAQGFGVAQQRLRVFLVCHARKAWQRAAAVLFEPEISADLPIEAAEPRAVAFTDRSREDGRRVEWMIERAYALLNPGSGGRAQSGIVASEEGARKFTPRECERLQGFPDDYTLVTYRGKPAADGPRYKALGNSMAVPCMSWLGRRIQMVEELCSTTSGAGGRRLNP